MTTPEHPQARERQEPDRERSDCDDSRPYAAVHAAPDGETDLPELVATASEYGFGGVVVRNHGDARAEYDADALSERFGVDVVDGVEVRAEDPSRAGGYVGSHRESATLVAVHGGTNALNRFAVEQPAVDVLAHPMAGDGDFNHVLAKTAARNGVRVELSLRPVLRSVGGERVRTLQDLRKLWDLLSEYDTPYVVSADAPSRLRLRAPRELAALGDLVGLDTGAVEAGLAEWGALARRNRYRHSDAFVEPGVRVVEPGDADDGSGPEVE
ncbi:MAG: RNase P subunit p30 family protein [Haloarculaceae archaeon]